MFWKVKSSISLKAYMDFFFNNMHPVCAFDTGTSLFCVASMFTYLKTCLYDQVLLCSWEEAAAPVLAVYRPTASSCTRTKPVRCPHCFAPE